MLWDLYVGIAPDIYLILAEFPFKKVLKSFVKILTRNFSLFFRWCKEFANYQWRHKTSTLITNKNVNKTRVKIIVLNNNFRQRVHYINHSAVFNLDNVLNVSNLPHVVSIPCFTKYPIIANFTNKQLQGRTTVYWHLTSRTLIICFISVNDTLILNLCYFHVKLYKHSIILCYYFRLERQHYYNGELYLQWTSLIMNSKRIYSLFVAYSVV